MCRGRKHRIQAAAIARGWERSGRYPPLVCAGPADDDADPPAGVGTQGVGASQASGRSTSSGGAGVAVDEFVDVAALDTVDARTRRRLARS